MTRILILFLFFFVFIINYLDQYFYFSLFSSPHFIKRTTFNNGKSFRAGIISDFQLPCFSDEKYSWQNIFISKLNRSLRILKAHRIEVLIIPGDIAIVIKIMHIIYLIKFLMKFLIKENLYLIL